MFNFCRRIKFGCRAKFAHWTHRSFPLELICQKKGLDSGNCKSGPGPRFILWCFCGSIHDKVKGQKLLPCEPFLTETFSYRANSLIPLCFSISAMGFFGFAGFALSLELAVEASYPMEIALSECTVHSIGQAFSILLVILGNNLYDVS